MILSRSMVEEYLKEVRNLGSRHLLYDIHVHPFDLFFDPVAYQEDTQVPGVMTTHPGTYRPPLTGRVALDGPDEEAGREKWSPRMLALQARMAYRHAGARALLDRMKLGGVGTCLLLPVVATAAEVHSEYRRMAQCYDDASGHFLFAVGIPGDVTNAAEFLEIACAQVKASAVKIHPNLSRVDIGSASGREWMESALSAASRRGLPCIVHGGHSLLPSSEKPVSFACMENLLTVDWSASDLPVVIAHAGAFGCPVTEVVQEVLPAMERLLKRHNNLFVDLSGLSYPVLYEVLKHIGPERTVFGSDELYFQQWKSMALLAHACRDLWQGLGKEFISITHENSRKILPGKAARHDRENANAALAV